MSDYTERKSKDAEGNDRCLIIFPGSAWKDRGKRLKLPQTGHPASVPSFELAASRIRDAGVTACEILLGCLPLTEKYEA
jgi:hypothetical protein